MKRKSSKNNKIIENKYERLKSYVSVSFVGLMTMLFPLFLTNRYFNARHDKLYLFFGLSALLVVCAVFVYLVYDKRNLEKKALSVKKGFKALSFVDWGMIAFGGSATISTLLSDNIIDSFTGNTPRNNGLLLIFAYIIVYFIISRTYKTNRIVPVGICVVSSAISVIGIVQQFYWNPFELYSGLDMNQCQKFISTIGNRNLFTAYLSITVPVCFLLFIYGKKKHSLIVSGLATAISFAGMICGNSDGCILGMIGLLAFSFIIFVRKINYLAKYFGIISIMLIACKLVRVYSYFMDDYYMGFSPVQKFLVYGNTYPAMVIFTLAFVGLLILSVKKKDYQLPKIVQTISIILLVVSVVGVIALVIYFSAVDTETKLSGVMKYLRFNDGWGTHRGFMWIRAFYAYIDFSIFEKLFGTGPDSFKNTMDASGFNEELMNYKGEVTDCAHNVYLNYLVTTGLAGAVSYLTVVTGSVVRCVRKALSNKYAVIFAGSVVCYGLQSIVNIDQPITTPIFILMLALLESENRKTSVE